tara:strand:+ start:2463 stop:3830 length:1368 start_codon:yes stop_codon:yes gene_type:complete
MEAEVEFDKDSTSDGDMLLQLAGNETSLLGLLQTLLSPRTLPHLALIVGLSTLLYWIANNDNSGEIAALGFISLSCGYGLTAMFSNNERIQSWIRLKDQSEHEVKLSLFVRLFSSFKICIFPLVVSGVLGLFTILLFAQESIVDLPTIFPLGLGSLFVLWAIAQGRSFGSWTSSLAAKRLPESESTTGNIKIMTTTQISALLIISVLGISGFEFLYEKKWDVADAIISNIGFFALAISAYGLTVALTWKYRQIALRDKALKQFASRWTMFAHVFATWHLLTVWRQIVMSPGTIEVFIEEVLLMMFTVFMAIWTITSQSVGAKFRFISTDNALPWGLSFGYAYAGSVAMLATAFNDITYVMVTGHIIAFLTITWMQRSVLARIIDQHDFEVEVSRVTEQSRDTPERPARNNAPVEETKSSENPVTSSDEIEVQWDGAVGPTISDDVEWGDVIELND